MLGQSIPQTDGVGKERAFQRVGAGEGDSEFHANASCIHVISILQVHVVP